MNFFGYKLGQAFPPPLDYPDFYTENLEPLYDYKINDDIEIQLSTNGRPDFLISLINARMLTLSGENVILLHNSLINELINQGFEISDMLPVGGIIMKRFWRGQYEGNISYEDHPNPGMDNKYFLFFVIKDNKLENKCLYE